MATTAREPQAALQLPQISLRCVPGKGAERGLVVGGVGSGKSVLSEMLGRDFIVRYQAKKARRLIVDSKPRFRAERTARGWKARRRYSKWDHGQAVPGSMLVESPEDLDLCWQAGCSTAIVQGESQADMPRMLKVIDSFYRQARANRPQLCQVDELMDWFSTNGAPRGGSDVLIRTARAGRERGLGALYCTQRTRQIPATVMEEMERLYLFRIDFKKDVQRLQEMGAPVDVEDVPRKNHAFVYWFKQEYEVLWGPYRLDLS